MLTTDIIAKKRDGKELTTEEIQFIVNGAADGTIPDYQLSSLLMAIFLNSMTDREISDLTISMAESGDMLDLSSLGENTVDKHSTGGVGDKITLICAPIAAAMGCTVAKMSGRGLGYTGGTVDKLESIDGYKTSISGSDFLKIAAKTGLCLVGQSGNFAPADKKLYALRDVTATVENIPLIASSIMSKKLAAGAKTIILDVKYGSGAFMKTPKSASELALQMVKIGKSANRKIAAIITDMNIPLGRNIGNSLEVIEAAEILSGKGDERLKNLSVTLAAYMYSLSFGIDIKTAIINARETINNGTAFNKLCEVVAEQGGDTDYLKGKKEFQKTKFTIKIKAEQSGYISRCDSLLLGKAAGLLGAGRETLDSDIDLYAGITLNTLYGEYVNNGDILAFGYTNKSDFKAAEKLIMDAFEISDKKPDNNELIYKIID